MTKITVDPSLSKGLSKRALRELDENFKIKFDIAWKRNHPNTSRTGNVYKSIVKVWGLALKDSLIHKLTYGKRKQEVTRYLAWASTGENLVVNVVSISRRNPSDPHIYTLFNVSKHAAQRVFERLNTTEISVLREEFLISAHGAMLLRISDIDHIEEGTEIPRIFTPHGVALLNKKIDETYWTVATWKSNKMFNNYEKCIFEQIGAWPELESIRDIYSLICIQLAIQGIRLKIDVQNADS